uniref:inactive peptidyl-prolyl cis-trans isomerase FKBP6-like n=1 Tax=Myxine glutinosa TaxID=7769 RepID=UPI003590103A
MQQMRALCLGGSNDADPDEVNMTPFEKLARSMFDLSGDGGVLKLILHPGIRDVIPKTAAVRVHYNFYLEYSEAPFDSSRLRNERVRLRLGKGEILPGLEIALCSMRVDELSQFLVLPAYAYGALGCSPRIPSNATLLMEVELLAFFDYSLVDEFYSMTAEERRHVPLEKILLVAAKEREAGNVLFRANRFSPASRKYLKALHLLQDAHLVSEEAEAKLEGSLIKVHLNLALCGLRRCLPCHAFKHASEALRLQPQCIKALVRLGQAHMMQGEFVRAQDCIFRAHLLAPLNSNIIAQLKHVNEKWQRFQKLEKDLYGRMFKSASSAQVAKVASSSHTRGVGLDEASKMIFRKNIQTLHTGGISQMSFPTTMLTACQVEEMSAMATAEGFTAQLLDKGPVNMLKISNVRTPPKPFF